MSQVVILPKIIASIITLALILLFSYPVLAQDATTPASTRKDRIEERKVKMATREAALKAKLEKFRDKKKAEIADRVNANLNKINQKQTEQMLNHLDRMSAILGKLKDTTAAKEAIATATASVKAQAEKDYTITVSSESTVRKDAQKIREQLHSDLKAVRVQVVDAKQSVSNTIRLAKSGAKEATVSGQQ